MPTYTYRCKECDYQFDERQSFSDDPLTVCPNCGADNGLRKVVNSVGIVFKGSGFYVTDNANGKGKVSLPANNNGSENTSSESNGSSDAKPAKSESKNDASEKSSTTATEKSTSA